MSIKRLILSFILIEVFTKSSVKGLQCYVCEQCNKYKDFKELHICGEISIATTMKTIVISESTNSNAINLSTMNTVLKQTSTKPSIKPSNDDYLYDDSEETNSNVSTQNSSTQSSITAASKTETTTKTTIQKTNRAVDNSLTGNLTTLAKDAIIVELKTTTQISATTTNQEFISKLNTNTNNKTDISALSTEKPKPILISDYDDYLEYEDTPRAKSLIKINKPVCYMIKYQVNNTIFTSRGCTSFINDNKYLTCQSLNNGAAMESCRVCSTNGCNKLFEDDDDDIGSSDGISFTAADVRKRFDIVVLFFWILLIRSII